MPGVRPLSGHRRSLPRLSKFDWELLLFANVIYMQVCDHCICQYWLAALVEMKRSLHVTLRPCVWPFLFVRGKRFIGRKRGLRNKSKRSRACDSDMFSTYCGFLLFNEALLLSCSSLIPLQGCSRISCYFFFSKDL